MERNLFTGDFETGNTSQFTSASGAATQVVVISGAWSGVNTDNQNFRKTLTSIFPTLFTVYGDFRWDTAVNGNLMYVLVGMDITNNDSFFIRTLTSGKLRVILPDTTTYDTTNTFSINTNYTIKLKYKYSVQGYFELYVNNILEVSAYNVNTTGGDGKDALFAIKWQGVNGGGSGNCYVDNCKIEILNPPVNFYSKQGFQ